MSLIRSLAWWTDPRARLERAAAREVAKAQRALLNRIAPDRTEETSRYYTVGDRWTRSLLVYDKPARTAPGWSGWLASLLLCDGGPEARGTVRLSITWTPYSPLGAGIKLGLAETGHQATLDLHARRGTIPGRDVKNAVRDVDRVQQALADAATRLLAVCVVVTCEGPSQDACDAVWRQVTGRLNARLLHWRPLDDRHALAFQQQTPGGARPIWHPLSWETGTLAASWPCLGETVDMGTGPVWGESAHTGRPVQYDPLDVAAGGPPAPHVCIIGPTGNGKSVAFFTVAAEYLTEPDPPYFIVIDPKGDYLRACAELGGLLIRLAEDAPVAINVFDLAPVEWTQTPPGPEGPRGPQPTKNVVSEGVRNVLGAVRLMCAASGAPFDPEQQSLTQTAALAAYRRKGIDWQRPRTWDVTRRDVPTLADLHAVLTEMGAGTAEAPGGPGGGEPAARRLAILLKPYALELWAPLFARHTTADLGNPFVVYDVRQLDDGLRPLAVHLIAAHTWREARRDPRRRVFAMDEVTQLLRYPESGRLVADVYLQGRFQGLSAWSMAQRTEHYTDTPEGRDALAMAHTVLLLRQDDEQALATASGRFKLTAGQRAYLETAGIGQGVLCTANRGNCCLVIDPPPVVLEWLPKSPAHQRRPVAAPAPELAGVA
jgi:conjugal transfer ATP-binding protein TraC